MLILGQMLSGRLSPQDSDGCCCNTCGNACHWITVYDTINNTGKVGLPSYAGKMSLWQVYSKIGNKLRSVSNLSSYRGKPSKNDNISLSDLYQNGKIVNFNKVPFGKKNLSYYLRGYPKGSAKNIPSSGKMSIGNFYNFSYRVYYKEKYVFKECPPPPPEDDYHVIDSEGGGGW